MTIGEKLRSARNAQNLSQEQLAQKLGIPAQHIVYWEDDLEIPDLYVSASLCNVLSISLEDLLPSQTTEFIPQDSSAQKVSENPVDYQADTSPSPIEATAEDYWNLPEGEYAELIDGKLYHKNAPDTIHQLLVQGIGNTLYNYIKSQKGPCLVLPAPYTVDLTCDEKTLLQPDILVLCDRSKLSSYDCVGAPDLIIEIVSKSNRKLDYCIKQAKYAEADVREYWIVDPKRKCTTIYHYEEDAAPMIIPFDQIITVGIFDNFSFCIGDLIDESLSFLYPSES